MPTFMKRNFFTSLLAVVLFLGLTLGATSCSSSNDDIAETQWKVVNILVKKSDWKWNSFDGQYEAIVSLPELTPFIYNEGAAIAYLKFNSNTKAPLPYSKSYSYDYTGNDGNTYTGFYTEHIKCDFQVGNPSTVAFYIEASDLERVDEYLENREFQVVLIW
ncbi:putative protein {ECO:0000313/EMBL:CEA15967,1} [Petrimonas mucosa]|jgi:hypothetical protein|uniref:Secreted protein n=2 Tax=Dysgonomonadaceae TaxID=2005520 RepID=A0A1G4G7Y2_9BACT|nr:putative protein {ECO:0000313/EMBL:CEA15967,1} [Petrimonas mucosa]